MHCYSQVFIATIDPQEQAMNTTIHLQPRVPSQQSGESDRDRRTRGILSQELLQLQNRVYAGSGGVSRNSRSAGFVPGFLDRQSGVAMVSRFANGRAAPIHVLEGLPEQWVLQRDARGRVKQLKPDVVAGFIRSGRFYTREEAARATTA